MTAFEAVDAINRYQSNRWLHPLTCGNPKRTETHILRAVLRTDGDAETGVLRVELVCPVCGWTQDWFPLIDFTALAAWAPPWAHD